ncbi:hypothetical protein STEG23_001206, partial [Scotinomys teguina]
ECSVSSRESENAIPGCLSHLRRSDCQAFCEREHHMPYNSLSRLSEDWHRWLHCMTDDPPTTKPPTARKFIWANHKFNVTGTPEQYVPYSTTRKKIQEWVPPSTPYK